MRKGKQFHTIGGARLPGALRTRHQPRIPLWLSVVPGPAPDPVSEDEVGFAHRPSPAGDTGGSATTLIWLYLQIESWLPEGAEQLDLGTAIHHHLKPRFLGQLGGAVIIDADLTPQHLGPHGDGLLRDSKKLFGTAENLHHVDGGDRRRPACCKP